MIWYVEWHYSQTYPDHKHVVQIMVYLWQDWKLPQALHKVLLFKIFKSGARSAVENYKPPAVLSHAQKALEKAIDMEIRGLVEFSSL